ncbi:GGDEF domain-containing protein [Ideonella paludis]|uniref:diguanylate cyclase n=1 Tax=Ideonella paludis TaxID=1233411 RepID=A0ABS5DW01_9BURK|nr:GGDEF domain-containing protein [Ideonella paludis]MBQ0935264.1 GGDEF domain-containing protein [Ideonella paludis]
MPTYVSPLLSGVGAPRALQWVWAGARTDDTATQRRKLMQTNVAAGMMMAIILAFNGIYTAIGNPGLMQSGWAQLPFAMLSPLIWRFNAQGRRDWARWLLFALAMGGCVAVITGGQGTEGMAHSYFLLYAVMAACFFPMQEWRSALVFSALNLQIFAALHVYGWPAHHTVYALDPHVLTGLKVALQGGCVLVVVGVVLLSETVAERNEHQLRQLAMTDLLTALPNRRAFSQALVNELARSLRHGHPLSLAVMDLDHFKRINDNHGHSAGDEALQHTAKILRSQARCEDMVARIGGEEFALLMPETAAEQALEVAERMRKAVMAQPLSARAGGEPVTTSVGVATVPPGMDGEQALHAADRALYEAKRRGRNCVVAAAA